MSIKETIENYLEIEERCLNTIKVGEFEGVPADSKMLITTAIQSKIDLLKELKNELE